MKNKGNAINGGLNSGDIFSVKQLNYRYRYGFKIKP